MSPPPFLSFEEFSDIVRYFVVFPEPTRHLVDQGIQILFVPFCTDERQRAVETVAFADVRPETLITARNSDTVKNLKDRRHDLYTVNWRGH